MGRHQAHAVTGAAERRARVIVGHGSRSARANRAFERFVQSYRERHPDEDVELGFLQLAAPTLEEVLCKLAAQCDQITVLPLFLFAAGHVKNDVPLTVARVQRAFPRVQFVIARPLDVHERIVAVLGQRLHEALGAGVEHTEGTQVMVVGRGSSDADANASLSQLVRLFGERYALARVELCFEAVARPSVSESLELLMRARPRRVVMLPYLLFEGVLVQRLRDLADKYRRSHPWIDFRVGAPVGLDHRLLDVFDERAEQALSGQAQLPCDTCEYRPSAGEVVGRVDGLSALLYSVRHSLTHAQASRHEHAHKPVRKHVLVCGNVDCASKGGLRLLGSMRRVLKAYGLDREIKVTRTSCMGQCGEGPAVAVYPDGIWYREVQACDAQRLVDEHLIGGRLVADLVDNIMT